MKRRVLNLLIALDQLAWVVLSLGNGSPDESISAAAWRMEVQGKRAGRVLRRRPYNCSHLRIKGRHMKYAYINGGVVVDISRVDPSTVFNPDYAALFIDAPYDVSHGWLYDGTSFTAPTVPPKTPEQLREDAKAARAAAVESITVTTQAGNTFDGDEISQTRMSRAVLVLSTGAALSVPWVLADNTVIQASAAELTEALALAGAEQARLWVLPSGII